MKLLLEIQDSDVAAVREVVAQQAYHPIVQKRMRPRVGRPTQRGFWQAQLIGLLTTQNKSGAGSAVGLFLKQKPFPITVKICRRQGTNLKGYLYSTFERSEHKFRRWKRISEMAASNFKTLEDGGWRRLNELADQLLEQRLTAPSRHHHRLEREAAHCVQELLKGLGPKQLRNFWQVLRLTRYEIPIDSRILKWSRERLGLDLPTQGLGNPEFYEFVMDALIDLCERAGVLPTEFDAAVFASFEEESAEVESTVVEEDDDVDED